jgi:DNA-binding transcriptional MerR regulator
MTYLPFRKRVMLGTTCLTLYSLGWLSLLAHRSCVTLRGWERSGLLPKPIFDKQVDPSVRYYTAGELLGYARIIRATRIENGKPYPKEFKLLLHDFSAKLKRQTDADASKVPHALPEEEAMLKSILANEAGVRKSKQRSALLLEALNVPVTKLSVNRN